MQPKHAKSRVYLGLPNYTNNFLRLGFTEEDIKGGGSDHLIDAIGHEHDRNEKDQRGFTNNFRF